MPEALHLRAFRTALATGGPERVATFTFGAATFQAFYTPLQPDDPRMVGVSDRLMEIHCVTADLPTPRPVMGDDILAFGDLHNRIVRLDPEPHGLTKILTA